MEHRTITERAYAKLNLTLDVVGLMPNGYHKMEMVMQSVSLWDNVTVEAKPGSGNIAVSTNRSYLPNNEKNLGYIAAKKYMDALSIANTDASLTIQKRIPVCAGMGGGSADAAAVLRAVNRLNGNKLTLKELEKMSESIGSDVPFCVSGGTVLAEGTGTDLTELPKMPECGIVIVKPRFSVQTPRLFAALDKVKVTMHPDTKGMMAALADGDVPQIARRCFNIFESVLPQKEADIVRFVKEALIDCGALGACMTGTGSAVYGIFTTEEEAKACCEELKSKYRECFWAKPV